MTKQELRKLIRQRKKQQTTEELSALSRSIVRSLLDRIKKEENCHTILLYYSLPDEVDTHDLIRILHAQGKVVLLPTVEGDDLCLHIYEGDLCLTTGTSFGILESRGPVFTDYSRIDLAIIPGMAFTPEGDRLGRGKGFYDRLLSRIDCPLIGIGYSFQLVEDIPTEPHDIRMNEVMTN